MPHYKDGKCVTIGDVVRGIGYNIKDDYGNPKVIVGIVVGLTLGESCNIRVAFLVVNEVPLLSPPITNGIQWSEDNKKYELLPVVEYGESKSFELIEPVLVRAFVEAKEMLLRPNMLGSDVYQLCNACATYRLYRERDCILTPFGHCDMIDIKNGDLFYCVPPATGA